MHERFASMARLPQDAQRDPVWRLGWKWLVPAASLGGLILGGIAMGMDLGLYTLVAVFALLLAAAVGDHPALLARVRRYELAHDGTVYRTEAGLRWDPPSAATPATARTGRRRR